MQFEEVGSGDILTGVKLFEYLFKKNESNLEDERTKIQEYTRLKETLSSITNQSRRQVLAPVAEGLAYFDAELISTNNILVLLGENWFSERSAVQAAAIAERRLDFLRREVKVLEEEKRVLQQRQEMFTSEIPEANIAMAKLMKKTEEGLSEALMTSHGFRGDAETPKNSVNITAKKESAVQELDRAVADNPELAVFDEQDELTEEELSELEKELGGMLDNDEIVERILTARMIAKKEKRIKAEMSRTESSTMVPYFRTDNALMCEQNTKQSSQHSQSEHCTSPELKASPLSCAFSSPADIGFREWSAGPEVNLTGIASSSPIEKASTLTPISIMSKGDSLSKTNRRVTFASEYTNPSNNSSSSLKLSTSTSMRGDNFKDDEVMTKQFHSKEGSIHDAPVPERRSLAIGDIVECDVNPESNSVPVLGSMCRTTSSKTRSSLFKRHLEGKFDDGV
ncbi:unnamed protein product [Phytomonas sp. Hart1]|nr:unnamed protein product [Phytomonas sp. Hart1]|eukprot:CCW67748.1 unnamed protein product [Phytomonas sp. isolate Hart1]